MVILQRKELTLAERLYLPEVLRGLSITFRKFFAKPMTPQEAIMQMVGPAFMYYVMNGRVAGPIGNRHPLAVAAPHGVFPCAGDDRWISIAVFEPEEWEGLVAAMGAPDWAASTLTNCERGRPGSRWARSRNSPRNC